MILLSASNQNGAPRDIAIALSSHPSDHAFGWVKTHVMQSANRVPSVRLSLGYCGQPSGTPRPFRLSNDFWILHLSASIYLGVF